MGLLPFDSCPSMQTVIQNRFPVKTGDAGRFERRPPGHNYELDFPDDFGGRKDDQNFLAATGPVGQKHVGLGSLLSPLASIANSMECSKLSRRQ